MITDFLKKYDNKSLIRGLFWIAVYLLWVIWLGNYWFLIGLPVVFDIYFTKKVNWSPWKKREGKNHVVIEWIDALIFAVVAVTIINIFLFQNYKIPTGSMEKSLQIGDHLYVSKVAYGPRLPMTPLSIPFMQNTIPGTTRKSYSVWPQWDYKRLKGFGEVKRWQPVVFNFPEGDTVCLDRTNVSYYSVVRDAANDLKKSDLNSGRPLKPENEYYALGRKIVWQNHDIAYRPIDKEDNYIKRCVGVPGDSLQVIGGIVYINGEQEPAFEGRQFLYYVYTQGGISNKRLKEMGIYSDEINKSGNTIFAPLTQQMIETLQRYKNVSKIEKFKWDFVDYNIFPSDAQYPWSLDNFGPIYIPKAGVTVALDMQSLPFYNRIIGHYEGNKLEVKDSAIYINGEIATSYTFKQDYYWMMGDNRHSSLDSRYWGYVPENHIIGTPRFIWLSLNKDKKFPANIRINRMFRPIR
ncbi:MAG: S26 family signal peptidase [Bacteroidales bacterium]|nr:S26 family signal peptidase [Bacteroidales bacterium]